ncbi:regulatory LuxR family protein [Solirubrobacter pauli]|uniref:Regulatory LuxR family protein n=1 Tax=Solirubrobacter pauli TaxID=166793 RepID=A0A660L3G4_9ACTN|nr:AAA family ATPase [Solirubrobacter pauli]RKQ87978.1 regulatory LuxR family protein [Solirubrobacter pauli]
MVIGRAEELAHVDRLLAAARLGTSEVLAITGEPGIGKTALLDYAVAHATGMTVLRAGGVESESEIPFAGLFSLLRPVLHRVDELPPPQATALRAALGLAAGAAGDRFLVGAATLTLLTGCAEDAPVLIVIDDAHWLDQSSLAAILFAARRLLADALALLIASRDGHELGLPELPLSGLDRAGAAALLERQAGGPLPPGATDRAFDATLGNPLALVELASAAATLPLEPGVPVQTTLELTFAARITALPDATRRLLALAAADEAGHLAVLARAAALAAGSERGGATGAGAGGADAGGAAAGSDRGGAATGAGAGGADAGGADAGGADAAPADALGALAAAEAAGLVVLAVDRLSFCHPLARAAAYRGATPDERRAAHRVLAEVEPDADRRAWHRAAAALGPDAEAAAALEQAGLRARDRGAYTAAASSLERAARLTTDTAARARRLFEAAEAAWLAGHADRADERLAEARELSLDPALNVEIDRLRGHAALRSGNARAAHDVLLEAADGAQVAEASGHAGTETPAGATRTARYTGTVHAAEMLAEAAEAAGYAAEPRLMLAAARRAWTALTPHTSERARVRAMLALGMALIYTGDDTGAPWLRDATDHLDAAPELAGDPTLLASAATGALWLREAERGRELMSRAIAIARAQGAVGALPFPLCLAGREAATSDRPHVAVALYEEAIRLARETGQAMSVAAGLSGLACVEARQGRDDACREHAAEALELTERLGLAFFQLWALDALADLELGHGNLEQAVQHLTAKERLLEARGIADPDVSPAPDLAEALTWLDRKAQAEPRLAAFARAARAKGQPWALARLARARGDYATALDQHARTPDRFETARTLLAQGEALRRERRRADAREPLRAAIAGFDALGAVPWAERARRELRASGETARRRDPLTLDALTPRELQVALVLAEGHTIREAAGKLFLSPKTVDHHLQSVYRKLAIDSRPALAAALDREDLPMRTPPAAA